MGGERVAGSAQVLVTPAWRLANNPGNGLVPLLMDLHQLFQRLGQLMVAAVRGVELLAQRQVRGISFPKKQGLPHGFSFERPKVLSFRV